MSEPAPLRPVRGKDKAAKTAGGWRINGSKIWTTSAQIADYMLALFRNLTADPGEPPPRADAVSWST